MRDATRRELIAGLRAAELKDLCIELGVEHTGRKAELYERVCERARKLSLSPAATSDVVCSRSCKLEVTDTALWERLWGSDTSNGGLRPRETVAMTEDEHLSHIEAEDAWRRLRMRVYVTSACSLYSAKLLDCPMVTPPPGLELQYARCRSNSGQTLWLLCSRPAFGPSCDTASTSATNGASLRATRSPRRRSPRCRCTGGSCGRPRRMASCRPPRQPRQTDSIRRWACTPTC